MPDLWSRSILSMEMGIIPHKWDMAKVSTDPVCGMKVHRRLRSGLQNMVEIPSTFAASRQRKFEANPAAWIGQKVDVRPRIANAVPAGTCPMHPEVAQDSPGSCPVCGMTLEPRTVMAEDSGSPELADMTRRLWGSALLTARLIVIMVFNATPSYRWGFLTNGPLWRWFEFALATPVVLWGGWRFFQRGWSSIDEWDVRLGGKAERVGSDTLLSQIVRMVGEAQRTRAPIQRLADKVSTWFVPAVMAISVIAFLMWAMVGPEPRYPHALVSAVAVLIIACPCALGLATPMSIMVGVGRGAGEGVLVRDAEALEAMEKVDTLVVDKTGTLTEGKPKLTGATAAENLTRRLFCNWLRAWRRQVNIRLRRQFWLPRRREGFNRCG